MFRDTFILCFEVLAIPPTKNQEKPILNQKKVAYFYATLYDSAKPRQMFTERKMSDGSL
jgi:hypothetical protein